MLSQILLLQENFKSDKNKTFSLFSYNNCEKEIDYEQNYLEKTWIYYSLMLQSWRYELLNITYLDQ